MGAILGAHGYRQGEMLGVRENKRTFSKRSLHGQLAHAIGLRIVAGEIAEGEVLPTEESASSDLSVSRTSYREAIKVLTAKGLVESRPKVGTRVKPRSEWNMLDPDVVLWAAELEPTSSFAEALFEFRLIIEPAAARLAAEKAIPEHLGSIRTAMADMAATEPATRANVDADLAFHSAILHASGNELLSSLSHVVETLLERSFVISSRGPGVRAASIPLHQSVCDHIADGKAQEAENAMVVLLTMARNDIDQILQSTETDNLQTRGES